MDRITKLPNGEYVCSKHGLVTCGPCAVDLSLPENPILKKTKGTGRIISTIFTPQNQPQQAQPPTPAELFPPTLRQDGSRPARFINSSNKHQVLVYTDGACLNNGQLDPRAGWAFVFAPEKTCSGRVENQGPFGGPLQEQTSNRAELRAAIAALRFRHWRGEGFASIVIATDSEYMVKGATTWARRWVHNGWRNSAGSGVKNRDLWELLLGEVEQWYDEGLEVVFWRIGRELNSVADSAAKKAAEEPDKDQFMDTVGAGPGF